MNSENIDKEIKDAIELCEIIEQNLEIQKGIVNLLKSKKEIIERER